MSKGKKKRINVPDRDSQKKVPEVSANGNKNIRYIENPDHYWETSPRWSFSKIDRKKWTIHDNFIEHILEKLISFEGMTWNQIRSQTRNGPHSHNTASHNIEKSHLVREAQDRLEEMNIYEDELFSLSLDNKKRLWGILDAGVLRIIWYDPNHEICPTSKRYT